jgi:pre-mRNA-splicing factor SPF27
LKFKEEIQFDPNYEKIRNYLLLLRAQGGDQKDIGENFFKNHKNEKSVYENLNKITDNVHEKDDIRLQAIVLLKRLYNITNKYLKYERKRDEDDIVMQDNHLSNALATEEMVREEKRINKRLNPLIDSLAYIDGHFREETRVKEEMNKLIREEMNKLATTKKLEDYLTDYQFPHLEYMNDPLILKEINRIEKDKKLNVFHSSIETKFEEPAPNKYHEYNTWEKLLQKVQLSLQQFNVKNFNLDLLIKFGPEAWKKYLIVFENLVNQLDLEKSSLERQCEEINKQRKFNQVEFNETMKDLESKHSYYMNQYLGIQKECLKLKYKIKKLVKYKKNKIRAKGRFRKLKAKQNK